MTPAGLLTQEEVNAVMNAPREALPSEVRAWARQNGFTVGDRGHMPKEVLEAYNRKHRKTKAIQKNPWSGA